MNFISEAKFAFDRRNRRARGLILVLGVVQVFSFLCVGFAQGAEPKVDCVLGKLDATGDEGLRSRERDLLATGSPVEIVRSIQARMRRGATLEEVSPLLEQVLEEPGFEYHPRT